MLRAIPYPIFILSHCLIDFNLGEASRDAGHIPPSNSRSSQATQYRGAQPAPQRRVPGAEGGKAPGEVGKLPGAWDGWGLAQKSGDQGMCGGFCRENGTSSLCHSDDGSSPRIRGRNTHNPWESIGSLSTSVNTSIRFGVRYYLSQFHVGRTMSVRAKIVKHSFTMCCEMCVCVCVPC